MKIINLISNSMMHGSINIKNALKISIFNITAIIFIIITFSFIIRSIINDDNPIVKSNYNGNTIRSTYPNYKHLSQEDALDIFTGYAAPGSSYYAFTGWRRNSYEGKSVNIEKVYRTRMSLGHSVNNSVWFFGGSTTWGTGATDDTTIPSFFSKITGEKVWNLGESGYNSFQELIQLQAMLVKGLEPKMVIFYDGVNESFYCNANVRSLPTHGRFDKYSNYVENYNALNKELKKANRNLKNIEDKKEVSIWKTFYEAYSFLTEPYAKLYEKYTDKRAIGLEPNRNLSTTTKFGQFTRKNNYKVCGDDDERAKAAASMTVETWVLAANLLNSRGIPFFFVLQPSSQIKPNSLILDYLLDSQKQRIVDESDSYQQRYILTRELWYAQCVKYAICDAFIDLSEVLVGFSEPVFIDAVHISANGNEFVARELSQSIFEKNINK